METGEINETKIPTHTRFQGEEVSIETLQKFAHDLGYSIIDDYGREISSQRPVAPPIGWKREPSLIDLVRDMVKSENLRNHALSSGHETFDEADDFEDDEDDSPHSPYEAEFEPVGDVKRRMEDELKREAAERSKTPPDGPKPPPEGGAKPAEDAAGGPQ